MKTFNEKIDSIDLSKFEIDKITKGEDFVMIKAHIYSPIYFVFYSHFITVSGDYGEWTFDCSWNTIPIKIPSSLSYLLGKLSRNCSGNIFDSNIIEEEFKKAKEDFYETYDIDDSYGDDVKNAVDEYFDDFLWDIRRTDPYRIVSLVDEYAEKICDELDIEEDTETWNKFYEIGETTDPQLIVVLAMLRKIGETDI